LLVAECVLLLALTDPSDSPLYSDIRSRVRKEVFGGAENRGWHRRGSEVGGLFTGGCEVGGGVCVCEGVWGGEGVGVACKLQSVFAGFVASGECVQQIPEQDDLYEFSLAGAEHRVWHSRGKRGGWGCSAQQGRRWVSSCSALEVCGIVHVE
jgi:hypothetical protein